MRVYHNAAKGFALSRTLCGRASPWVVRAREGSPRPARCVAGWASSTTSRHVPAMPVHWESHNCYIGSIVYIRYWMLYIRLHISNWILYGLEPSWSHLGSSRKPYIGFYKTYIGFYRFGAIVEPSWELPKAFTIMLFRCTNGKSEGDESCRREDERMRQNVQKP